MERLVQHENPEARPTPTLLLAELRTIDPTVELVYAGTGIWWLGAVADIAERKQMAEHMMSDIERLQAWQRTARTVMLCKLNLQGFALIEAYHGPDPAGTVKVNPGPDEYYTTIVEDFRERDAHFRRDHGRRVMETRLDETMRGPQRREAEAKVKEYLYTDGRDRYRREFRNRVTVGAAGLAEHERTSMIETVSYPSLILP